MQGYSYEEMFSPDSRLALEKAREVVRRLPERDAPGDRLRCHEVVRVVKEFVGDSWRICDGKYRGVDHSWLDTIQKTESNRRLVILDPYRVGSYPMVALMASLPMAPLDGDYKLDPGARRDVNWSLVKYLISDLGPLDRLPDRTYPCRECGRPRTKAEGGTVFTVCDDCWGKKPFNALDRIATRLRGMADAEARRLSFPSDRLGGEDRRSEFHDTVAELAESMRSYFPRLVREREE